MRRLVETGWRRRHLQLVRSIQTISVPGLQAVLAERIVVCLSREATVTDRRCRYRGAIVSLARGIKSPEEGVLIP